MELNGKVALVTGSGHRVGRGIALALAAAGCNLAVHYRSSSAEAEETVAAARSLGVETAAFQADLTETAAIDALLRSVADTLGPVQVLVNSAAGFGSDSVRDVTRDQLMRTLLLNLTAPALLTGSFARALPDDLAGSVVNVTDWKTVRPYVSPPRFSYTVAKGALDTMTRVAAAELAPRIRVNAVALGVILPPADADDAYADELAAQLPLQRVGGAEVVGEAVVALCRNDFITGEIVRLDGGGHLA